jgi:hypothetical protein
MSLFEKAIQEMVAAEVEKLTGKKKKMTPFQSRESHKWDKEEEELLIRRVSVFLDSAALAHRRKRGGITTRLNKLLKEGRLCGLRSGSSSGLGVSSRRAF